MTQLLIVTSCSELADGCPGPGLRRDDVRWCGKAEAGGADGKKKGGKATKKGKGA